MVDIADFRRSRVLFTGKILSPKGDTMLVGDAHGGRFAGMMEFGRHSGLKIRFSAMEVPVRVRLPALSKGSGIRTQDVGNRTQERANIVLTLCLEKRYTDEILSAKFEILNKFKFSSTKFKKMIPMF